MRQDQWVWVSGYFSRQIFVTCQPLKKKIQCDSFKGFFGKECAEFARFQAKEL
jgi:hypothetical protein